MTMEPIVWIVLIMVLGPIIGSFIGILGKPSFGYICNMLCFAAGVMPAISFLELIPGAGLKSFLVSSSTAVPIVAGYVLARYLFQNISPHIIGFIIGATAGLMIYITVDELIPNGCAGSNHQTIFSLITGILFVILLGSI